MLGRLPAGEFAAENSPPDRRLLFSRRLGLDAGELDNAPFAQDLEGDRLAGLLAAQALLDGRNLAVLTRGVGWARGDSNPQARTSTRP